jgi:hypothetical protein
MFLESSKSVNVVDSFHSPFLATMSRACLP